MADTRGAESLFDRWAASYDAVARSGEAFPFAGYEATLDRVVALVAADRGQRVLDLGIGTGNLAKRFVAAGCSVWGIDLSSDMLAVARSKLPDVHLHHGDFLCSWPVGFPERFERIVSTYAFHHIDDRGKVELIARLLRHRCTEGGLLAIGDISFATRKEMAEEERSWGDLFDPDEHYWVAEQAIPACEAAGFAGVYEQTSRCAGVYVFRNPVPSSA